MRTDKEQLKLIQESIYRPEAEEEAKKLLLKEIYEEVLANYAGYASNGGKLAELSDNVKKGEFDPDDLKFTYNAIRVLLARYLSRNAYGKLVETPSMVMKRVAAGFSSRVDSKQLYEILIERRFVFNSPTLFNMYCDGAKGALSACYVTPVYDDMEAIMEAARVQAMTFKYGGGQGFSFSNLRPRWSVVKGTGGYSSGPMSFMRIYDVVTEAVKQGGKRRGANMGILHDWHADIYNPYFDPMQAFFNALPIPMQQTLQELVKELQEYGFEVSEMLRKIASGGWNIPEDAGFVQAKRYPLGDAFLTNFNISVGIHDAFMEAVIKDEDWIMFNPQFSEETTGIGDYKVHYSVSRATGLGRLGKFLDRITTPFFSILEDEREKIAKKAREILRASGYTETEKNPYYWRTRARIIWQAIVRGAWETGDPGLIFLDNHNKWNPTPWLGIVTATNPCGEQPLYPYESCNLGSMSVEKYLKDDKTFDIERFAKDVQFIIDAMDAVIDLNKHPDERQTKANLFTRKIGLGIMGLADLLAKLDMAYDSDEAVVVTMVLMAALEVFGWKRSWELGAKLGHAPAFECKAWDWRRMRCLEKAEPEELLEMHTPALLKVAEVVRLEDGWLKVHYHDVNIPESFLNRLVGESRNRVEPDGSVKLLKLDALKRVLEEVFRIDEQVLREAESMEPEKLVNSPRHLLALAIFRPADAWKALVAYGRSLGARAPRNTVITTVAPTGTISIIAGTSSGIEPYFALVFKRKVAVGEFLEVVKEFRNRVIKLFEDAELPRDLLIRIFEIISSHKGSLRWALENVKHALPRRVATRDGRIVDLWEEFERLARIFATSMDFDPWYHVAHNAAAQLFVDQSISKTVNLPKDAGEDAVETVYFVAWLLGLKGVTVYRDESKSVQVIYFGAQESRKLRLIQPKNQLMTSASAIYANGGSSLVPEKLNPSESSKLEAQKNSKQKTLNFSFNFKQSETLSSSSEIVMDVDENSTCKTCHL
jgi:ribonucleoside-diphosphate reductase alpha chain